MLFMPVFALTAEVSNPLTLEANRQPNFLQEFDITFWQTLPFASFWGYVVGTQMASGGAVNWNLIFPVVTGVSLLNANLHAKKTIAAHSALSQ